YCTRGQGTESEYLPVAMPVIKINRRGNEHHRRDIEGKDGGYIGGCPDDDTVHLIGSRLMLGASRWNSRGWRPLFLLENRRRRVWHEITGDRYSPEEGGSNLLMWKPCRM